MIPSDFFISDDSTLLQLDRIHSELSTQTYWCLGIPKEIVRRAIEGSLCFGVYQNTESGPIQVGFARIITDRATFAYLCDVYIEQKHRGQGLSKLLMNAIMSHPDLQGLRRFLLATRDAHALYRPFGFKSTDTPDYWMEIKDNDLYRKQGLN